MDPYCSNRQFLCNALHLNPWNTRGASPYLSVLNKAAAFVCCFKALGSKLMDTQNKQCQDINKNSSQNKLILVTETRQLFIISPESLNLIFKEKSVLKDIKYLIMNVLKTWLKFSNQVLK